MRVTATFVKLTAMVALAAPLAVGMSAHSSAAEVTIVGAGPGAGAYQLAGAMAEAVNRSKVGITMTNRASQGFVANTRMVERGTVEFGMTNGIFVYDAQRGHEPFKEMKAKNLRGVGPVSNSWFQMAVLANSKVKSYMDLKGKRVNYAQKGSNTEYMTRVIFERLGINDSIRKEYMRWDQAETALVDGNIDAFGIPNPLPSPSILQADASSPVRILPVPAEVIKWFEESNPGYFKSTVKPGVYNGQKEAFDTVTYTMFATVNANVPDDVVYKITKATYGGENREFLINAMRAWRGGLDMAKDKEFIQRMKSFGLKLHPGAERFWKEVGLLS